MNREKTVGAIVISVIAFVIVAVIVFATVMNSNGVITYNGNLMEKVNAKRITKGKLNDEFKEKYADFCIELADSVAGSKENVAFAPSNLMAATAFLAAASDEITADELERALGMRAEDVGKAISVLENKIAFKDDSGLQYSTTAWLNGSTPFGIRKSFLKENGKVYGLGINREDFSLEKIEDIANKPILDATKSSIFSSLIFENGDFMNIISGSSFSSNWVNPVSSEELPLGLFAGSYSEQECGFFKTVEDKYLSGTTYVGAIKELEGGYSFVGLVPKKEGDISYYGVADVTRELKGVGLLELMKKAQSKKVAVALPQYTNSVNIPSTTNFTEALEDMGVVSALKTGADMTNMAPNSYNLHLNNLVAAGDISISATGCCPAETKGKKVSQKELEDCEVSVRFDSSFIYFIYDNESGLPVYCGILNRLL